MNTSLHFIIEGMVEVLLTFFSENGYLVIEARHLENPYFDDFIVIDTMDNNGVITRYNSHYLRDGTFTNKILIQEELNFRMGISISLHGGIGATKGIDLLPVIGLRRNS